MSHFSRLLSLSVATLLTFSTTYAACNSQTIGFRIQNKMPANSQCKSGPVIQTVGPVTDLMTGSFMYAGDFGTPLTYENMTENDITLCANTGASSIDGFTSLVEVPITIACAIGGQSKTLNFAIGGIIKGSNPPTLKVDTGPAYSAPCSTSISTEDGLTVQINSNCANELSR